MTICTISLAIEVDIDIDDLDMDESEQFDEAYQRAYSVQSNLIGLLKSEDLVVGVGSIDVEFQ